MTFSTGQEPIIFQKLSESSPTKRLIRQTNRRPPQSQSVLVEAKVDAQGQAGPVSIWVGNASSGNGTPRNYRF